MALQMDVAAVIEIVEAEFGLGEGLKPRDAVAEEGAGPSQTVDYQAIETSILNPVREAYDLIIKISLAIGCLYGAHG